jgi:hypothetical protein
MSDDEYAEKVGVVCYTESTSSQWRGVRTTPFSKLSDFFRSLEAQGWRIDLLDEVEITVEGCSTPLDGIQFALTRGDHGEHRTVWVMTKDEHAEMTMTGKYPVRRQENRNAR